MNKDYENSDCVEGSIDNEQDFNTTIETSKNMELNNVIHIEMASDSLPINNNDVFKSNFIQMAISKTIDNQPLNEIELAKIANFTDKEIEMLKMFWEPCFNSSWIYLSDELISNYLTDETGKNYIYHFYERILFPNCEKNVDYKEVDKNHDLVKFGSPKIRSDENKTKRQPHNKKYYIVTGECLKTLLLQSRCDKGKETRRYYIKVENLARYMKDYILLLNQLKYDNLLQNHTRLLKKRKRESYTYGSVIYIVSHEAFFSHYDKLYYKIGKSKQNKDENESAFVSRISSYNTGAPINYTVHYLCYLDNVDLIENSLKERFSKDLNPANKEWIENINLKEISDFIHNLCELLKIEYNEVIYDKTLLEEEDVIEIEEEDLMEIEDENEQIEDEFDEYRKELQENYNFKGIRKLCKELHIIQLGNKDDMIERIIKFKKQQKKKEQDANTSFIYQYSNKGVFIAKFKSIDDIKIEGIEKQDILDCINNLTTKAGDFIWKDKETTFTVEELKEINRKNRITVIKYDSEHNEVKRYDTVKECADDIGVGRGVIDRLLVNGKLRDGFYYKMLNKENKVVHLTPAQKLQMKEDRKNGMNIKQLSEKYNKIEKYIRVLLREE